MNKINLDLMVEEILKIQKSYELVAFLMKEEKQDILKHIAAASIHIIFFMNDVYEYIEKDEIVLDDKYKELFLENCGCNKFKENK